MASVSNRGTKDKPQWYVRFVDLDGKRKNRPTHQLTRKDAEQFGRELEARVARGESAFPDQRAQRAKLLTVRELTERFLVEYNPSRLKDREVYIAGVRSVFVSRLYPYPIADLTAVSVRKIHVASYQNALRLRYKHGTVNVTLAFLSRLYSWAINEELIDCRNPCSSVERLKTTPSEEHYTRADVDRLLSPEFLHPQVAMAIYTGMRVGELRGLTWACVDFGRGSILVKASYKGLPKNGKARLIPLHSELRPILSAWREKCPPTAQNLVFPVNRGKMWRMGDDDDTDELRDLLKAAGVIADFKMPWHAFKHTATSLMVEAGVDSRAIDEITAHPLSGNRITAS